MSFHPRLLWEGHSIPTFKVQNMVVFTAGAAKMSMRITWNPLLHNDVNNGWCQGAFALIFNSPSQSPQTLDYTSLHILYIPLRSLLRCGSKCWESVFQPLALSTDVMLFHVIFAISSTTIAVVVLSGKIKYCRKQVVAGSSAEITKHLVQLSWWISRFIFPIWPSKCWMTIAVLASIASCVQCMIVIYRMIHDFCTLFGACSN